MPWLRRSRTTRQSEHPHTGQEFLLEQSLSDYAAEKITEAKTMPLNHAPYNNPTGTPGQVPLPVSFYWPVLSIQTQGVPDRRGESEQENFPESRNQ